MFNIADLPQALADGKVVMRNAALNKPTQSSSVFSPE